MKPSSERFSEEPLACRQLALPEQVVIWLIRTATDRDIPSCVRTLEQVFGRDRLDHAMTALERLRTAALESPLDVAPFHPLAERALAPAEADLITAIARAQAETAAVDLVDVWGWPAEGQQNLVAQGVNELAGLLARSGRHVLTSATRPMLGAKAVSALGDLDWREQAIVLAVREWVQVLKESGDTMLAVRCSLKPHRLQAAAAPLNTILHHTSVAATRHENVQCRTCAGLGEDEKRLLLATAAAQRRGRETISFELLADWMKPTAARMTLPVVTGLALALSGERHRLPLRDWYFPEIEGTTTAAVPQRPRTLH